MADVFNEHSEDLSFKIASSVSLNSGIVVTRYKSTAPDFPAENHAYFRRSLFTNATSSKVAVIAVGGTGHSPWPEGYIGSGMLTAAVTGAVYMAPSPEAIRATLEFVAPRSNGILIIAVNHLNDQKNVMEAIDGFEIWARRTCSPNFRLAKVPVSDEAASGRSRRGLAGAVLVVKLAGAAAEMDMSIIQVRDIATKAAESVVTYAAANVTCSVAGRDVGMLREKKVQIGVGIHGERGEQELLKPSSEFEVVERLCEKIYTTLEQGMISSASQGMVLMVNNMGSMSPSEMLSIRNEISGYARQYHQGLAGWNRVSLPAEIYSGCFMTSLGTIGFSVSTLVIQNENWMALLHAPTEAEGWNTVSCVRLTQETNISAPTDFGNFALVSSTRRELQEADDQGQTLHENVTQNHPGSTQSLAQASMSLPENCILAVARALIDNADKLGELDRIHGNGSLGKDAKRVGEALMIPSNFSTYGVLARENPAEMLNRIAETTRRATQGSFGKFTKIFLREMASFMRRQQNGKPHWKKAFSYATSKLSQEIRKPQRKSRTMMAALVPAARLLSQPRRGLGEACDAALYGSLQTGTAQSSPQARSSAINFAVLKDKEDPGATLVCICLDAIKKVVEPS